jgi:hypothetical protein
MAIVVALGLALLLWGAVGAEAATPPDPASNFASGRLPVACSAPTSTDCENASVYYLDQARVAMGLGPYRLPPSFAGMSADEQIFILTNLDREAYGSTMLTGLNAEVSAAAYSEGVYYETDPGVNEGSTPYGWHSGPAVWAGSFVNAPAAYFEWVYDDGYGSTNADCPEPTSTGCWGHRHVLIGDGSVVPGVEWVMGAAAGSSAQGHQGYAALIVGARPGEPPSYYYTWGQAVAEGAGTNEYNPGVPVLSEPTTASQSKTVGTGHAVLSLGFKSHRLVIGAGSELDGVEAKLKLFWKKAACPHARGRRCRRTRVTHRSVVLHTPSTTAAIRWPRRGEQVRVQLTTAPFTRENEQFQAAKVEATIRGHGV